MTLAPPSETSSRFLSAIAAVSGVYDAAVGIAMLAGQGVLATAFGVPRPVPPIHADLNGLFLLAIAAGYILPWRRPDKWRAYLWIMGPMLKGGGALLFVADHFARHSPNAYLLFAASDGALALVTLWALLARDSR